MLENPDSELYVTYILEQWKKEPKDRQFPIYFESLP